MNEKTVSICGDQYVVRGLGERDPYFQHVVDGLEEDFGYFTRRHLSKDSLCWDLGANIGITALLTARACPVGKVAAVDGGKTLVGMVGINANLNDVTNIMPIHAVVGNRNDNVNFVEDSAYGHIAKGGEGETVKMITPETLMRDSGYERLDFVKIDIEGMEPEIIDAGAEIFKRFGTILHMEFNSWCLMYNGRVNPLFFAENLFGIFPHVYLIAKHGDLKEISKLGAAGFIHDHLVHHGAFNDIVLSFRQLN